MASSRELTLAAFQACLARIDVASGFNTDAGLTLTLEPAQVDNTALAALAVVLERQQRATDPAVSRTHRLTTFAVIGKVPATLDNAQTRIDALVDDIERAMGDQQFRFPTGVAFPQYQEMQPLPPEPGGGWVGAVLRYTTHLPIR